MLSLVSSFFPLYLLKPLKVKAMFCALLEAFLCAFPSIYLYFAQGGTFFSFLCFSPLL